MRVWLVQVLSYKYRGVHVSNQTGSDTRDATPVSSVKTNSSLHLLLLSKHNHHVDYFVAIRGLHCEGERKSKKATGIITRLADS